ncbi:MAG: hypothetical protein QN144_12510 [Armatimonadota bacterium]|nr:hypothetical protein [Armatimonadota bacterium]
MRLAVAVCSVVVLFVGAAVAAQTDGRLLTVRVYLAGEVDDGPQAGYYYVAFSTLPGLLTGPTPTGENWTHYALYYRGRFYFASRRTLDLPPSLFRTTLPPEPYTRGNVSPDRRVLSVDVPLQALWSLRGGQDPIKVNVVTADRWYRPVDALGKGPDDPLGFVSFDPQREVLVRVQAPAGNAPPSYDVVGAELRVWVP